MESEFKYGIEYHALSRKEFYKLVWSESLLSLSRKYAISDVGLRKICIKMRIPLPKNGDWAKMEAGKKVYKAPLPNSISVPQETALAVRSKETDKAATTRSILSAMQIEIESDPRVKLTVPISLSNPDKLIIASRNILSTQKPDDYLYKGTISCSRDGLDIRVGQKNISRALRFMDTLIKALRARGHTIELRNHETYVVFGEDDFRILFREKMKMIPTEKPYRHNEYYPSGILSFQQYHYPSREWKDGKKPLESYLSAIIARLELTGKEWADYRAKQRKAKEDAAERQRIQDEIEKRKEKEVDDFKGLLYKASRWQKTKELRNYLVELEEKALATNNITRELKDWLHWAREKADWFDPFIEKDDKYLDSSGKFAFLNL